MDTGAYFRRNRRDIRAAAVDNDALCPDSETENKEAREEGQSSALDDQDQEEEEEEAEEEEEEGEEEEASDTTRYSRYGRIIRKPSRYDEYAET